MSNNYNSTLQSNNTDLQAILNTINELPEAGGGDPVLQDKTVTPTTSKQTVTADSGYDGLDTVTVNAMPTATQATPNITVNSSGLITATVTQAAGYVAEGSEKATKQLTTQAAQTITPGTSNKTIASGRYLTGTQTIKGDSNLIAGNIKSGVSIFGVAGNYEGSGGDTSMEDGMVARTTTSYTNSRVSSIGSYAFYSYYKLTSVNFPACTSIDSLAFCTCSSLISANFPACTTIGASAFYSCFKLASISFPKVTTIGWCAFIRCSSLTSVNFPACKTIGSQAFNECINITSISFPACTTISSVALAGLPITSADFPACKTISYAAFRACSNLTSISFPACTTIGSHAFQSCSSLTSVSFPKLTTINANAFARCISLSIIYLTASSVCSLANSNAFVSTSIWSTTGSIFVPASLVSSYKTATNWAFFSNRIFGFTSGPGVSGGNSN